MRTGILSLAILALPLSAGCGAKASDVHGDSGVGADGGTPNDGTAPRPDAVAGQDGARPMEAAPGTDGGPVDPTGITIVVEPDGTRKAQALLSAIDAAKTAVHVEMYLITNDTYVEELIALANAGKDVKVILNKTFPSGTSVSDTNADSYAKLAASKVGVHWAPTTTGFDSYTHEKTVIIDPAAASGAQAWIMTMNLDYAGPEDNREFLAQDTNAADIAEAEAIFEADYAGTDITPTGGLVVAPSPQNNASKALAALVESATKTIDMEAEEFGDTGTDIGLVFNALTAKAKAGVQVRLVLEDSSYSTQTDAVNGLVAAGGQVVGYSCTGKLDIHAKALVADGARAYIGSENFSEGSLGYNRELGVTFVDPAAVALVYSTITGDFAAGSPYASTCSF